MSMAVHIVFSVDRQPALKGSNDTQWTLCVIRGVPRKCSCSSNVVELSGGCGNLA